MSGERGVEQRSSVGGLRRSEEERGIEENERHKRSDRENKKQEDRIPKAAEK